MSPPRSDYDNADPDVGKPMVGDSAKLVGGHWAGKEGVFVADIGRAIPTLPVRYGGWGWKRPTG